MRTHAHTNRQLSTAIFSAFALFAQHSVHHIKTSHRPHSPSNSTASHHIASHRIALMWNLMDINWQILQRIAFDMTPALTLSHVWLYCVYGCVYVSMCMWVCIMSVQWLSTSLWLFWVGISVALLILLWQWCGRFTFYVAFVSFLASA